MFKLATFNILLVIILVVMVVTLQPVTNYLFFFLLVVSVNLGARQKFALNPYYLFSITILSLILYNPNLSSFLATIPLNVYILIFLGLTSFLMGLVVVDKNMKPKKFAVRTNATSKNKRLFWLFLFLGLTPHVIGFITVGFPILAVDNVADLRENYLPAGLSYFTLFLPLTITIGFINKDKKLIWISVILNAFISVVKVAKFDVLIFIFFFVFSVFKYGNVDRKQFKKYFIYAAILFAIPLFFNWFRSVRSQTDSISPVYLLSGTGISDSFSYVLSLPYLYFTTGWSNLAETVQTVEEFNYGIYTLHPFISALQLDDFISYASYKTIYLHPFNTFSFLTDYYMDFGVIGILILPFIVAQLVFYSYKRSMQSSNPIRDGQFIVLAIPTLMLFFSNHFTSVGYPFIVYILYGIIGKLKLK